MLAEIKGIVNYDKEYDLYEEYIAILEDGKEICHGNSYSLPYLENGEYIFHLSYTESRFKNFFKVFFRKLGNKVILIPDNEFWRKKEYFYEPLEFFMEKAGFIIPDIHHVKNLTTEDIVLSWVCGSRFGAFCSSYTDYKKKMVSEIYFVDDERIDNSIAEFFFKIFDGKSFEIEKTGNSSELQKIDVYLDCGIVWKAFFRKGDNIYLNTGLDMSIRVL